MRRPDCVASRQRCGHPLFRASCAQRGSRRSCWQLVQEWKNQRSVRVSELRIKIFLPRFSPVKNPMPHAPRARLRIVLNNVTLYSRIWVRKGAPREAQIFALAPRRRTLISVIRPPPCTLQVSGSKGGQCTG